MSSIVKKLMANEKVRKCILGAMALSIVYFSLPALRPSNGYIRNRVVKLVSDQGSCSGQQVVAASGMDYILTAAHCKPLQFEGSIMVKTDDGRSMYRRIIAEDETSDLLLLEGIPNLNGLAVASASFAQQHVRTFTHGRGFDTYETQGELIQDYLVNVLLGMNQPCPKAPKFKVESVETIFGPMNACLLSVQETVTTAMIVPGSSGGAVVNDAGELVGVVSAGDGHFGFLVRIQDIKKFLRNY